MEKLAKALNKARQEREQVLAQAPAAGNDYQAPQIVANNVVAVDTRVLERNHIIAHRTRSKEADVFRILRTQVLQAMSQHSMRTLGVTSPNHKEGKTTVALNLALSIALDLKQTVLLVDLDLRKPSVPQYMGLDAPAGLTDYFSHNTPIAECLIRPSFDRLSILPVGRPLENSSEALGSPKIAALASELRSRYADRLIIYDLPPVLTQDDSMVFVPHMDAVLLVTQEGADTHDLRRAMHALGNAHVIGTVLNQTAPYRGIDMAGLMRKFRTLRLR